MHKNNNPVLCSIIAVVLLALPSLSWAKPTIDTRVERLERLLENQLNVELLSQVEALQQELRELRGQLEEQDHQLQQLRQRQAQLYSDLDTRVKQLAKATAPTAQTTQAPTPSEGAVTSDQAVPRNVVNIQAAQSEKGIYDMAYQLMEQKKYPDAITAFQDYLWKYPQGDLVANAHYWLGEIYLVRWYQDRANTLELQKAIQSFKVITISYQGHHKAVDALLKLGLIELDQAHWDEGRQLLKQVIANYPDSSRARIAESRLLRLKQEGHAS